MGTWLQDLRYGLRGLRRSPGFTATALLTLALGLGANCAVFSVVNAVLLRPLPFAEPERLVTIFERDPWGELITVPPHHTLVLEEQGSLFEGIAYFVDHERFSLTGGAEPERIRGSIVSASFFTVLGVEPAMGRAFTADDDMVAVVSHRLWTRRYGSDPDLLGRSINVNDRLYSVIGVMPAGFDFSDGSEVWVPDPFGAGRVMNDGLNTTHYLNVIARLRPGVTLEQARLAIDSTAAPSFSGDPRAGNGFVLFSLEEQLLGRARPTLLVLLGAVAFVLLIGCGNVANLLLARAAARQREQAIRVALGAGRVRLARQTLVECLLLALLGGGLGLGGAVGLVKVLVAIAPAEIPRLATVAVDARVAGFAFALALASGLAFGLGAALRTAELSPRSVLGDPSRGAGLRQSKVRGALVVCELALALVLLSGAGLMLSTVLRLSGNDVGFDPGNVLTLKLTLTGSKYQEPGQRAAFFERVLERVQSLPRVEHAGGTDGLPLSGDVNEVLFLVEGAPPVEPGREPTALCSTVTDQYFRALRIRLLEGRLFSGVDGPSSPPVLIVDETLARRYWPGESARGKRLFVRNGWREIVGVVASVRHHGPGSSLQAQVYVPFAQEPLTWPRMYLVVRAATAPLSLAPTLRHLVAAEDDDQPVEDLASLDHLLDRSIAEERFAMLLIAVFATLSVGLAALGVYGVTAYSVAQRTGEIGIRMAVGARDADVLRLVMRQGVLYTLAGLGLGLGAALALTRLLSSLLYGVTPTDPLTFLVASQLLCIVALAATAIPAWRASRLDPVSALQGE